VLTPKRILAVLGLLVAAMLVSGALGMTLSSFARSSNQSATPRRSGADSPTSGELQPVIVHAPPAPPRVTVGTSADGEAVTVRCSTCHSTRPPNRKNAHSSDLDEFHQGLAFAHGESSCLSCHDPENYDQLRLADGRAVQYADVMTLCGQCHGPQLRDYRHGSHGGMSGYWDLSRGPRTRNHCVDCHDPHAPAFPSMRPTFKPFDRFLSPDDGQEESH